MKKNMTIVVTGDSAVRKRVSVSKELAFLSLVDIIREADVAFTNHESIMHDYDGPEVYPCESGGGTWQWAPRFMAEELKWMGINMVSRANNHALDYFYGGMFNTSKILDSVGIVHAGVGRNLAEAREPAYLDTEKGRVALISISSTFSRFKRAGEQKADVKGRPGLNPLRYYHVVDSASMEKIKDVAENILGMECFQDDDTYYFVRPGVHNSVYKFVIKSDPGTRRVAWEDDVEGNLRSIKEARRNADWVLVQLHFHEWEVGKNRDVPAEFVTLFARKCIDAGADVFIGQGAHILMGMEIYRGKPIFYEPQTFVSNGKVTRLPAEYFLNVMYQKYAKIDLRSPMATVSDALEARRSAPLQKFIKDQIPFESRCSVMGECAFDKDRKLTELKLYPFIHSKDLPMMADKDAGKKIIDHFGKLSAPFGTVITFEDGIGRVKLK